MNTEDYVPLRPEDIYGIADLAVERYGRQASDRDTAVQIVKQIMRDLGCTEKQIELQRIEVSREIMNIRRAS